MSNPYFDRSPAFNERGPVSTAQRTPNGYPAMPGYEPGRGASGAAGAQTGQAYGTGYSDPAYGQTAAQQYQQQYGQPYGAGTVSPEQLSDLESTYGAPSATNVDRGLMTYDDVIVRTAGIFAVIVGVGAVSWFIATNPATYALGALVMVVGCLGSLVMGLVNSFKKVPSPALIMTYAVFEGAMLGAVSGVVNLQAPGVVIEAVLATLATFAVMLVAYKVGSFRVQGKAARILVIAMGGYALFALVNLVLQLTGVLGGWGLYDVTFMGIPLGIVIGAVAILMAAFSLAMDFESIQRGVERGLPRVYAWAGAFGLVVTLVWLYVEFLRILAILRDN